VLLHSTCTRKCRFIVSNTGRKKLAQTCSFPPADAFVMVGDSYNNHSVQFQAVIPISDDDRLLSHPQYDIALYKIAPVSFDDFRPVKLQMDANALSQGQNLTSVAYNLRDYALNADFSGQAYECPLQVQHVEYELFSAKPWVYGPCMGASYARSSVIAAPKIQLTFTHLIAQGEISWC
jgi:hypothetical protein